MGTSTKRSRACTGVSLAAVVRGQLAAWIVLAVVTPMTHAQWSVVSLHPAGATASHALGIRSGQQVGEVDGSAGLWTGTAGSFVNLGSGVANGTDGVEQAGVSNFAQATVWSGTASSSVNLTPPVANLAYSNATGVHAGLQCGMVATTQPFLTTRAGIWSGSGASWIDLNPSGATESNATGVHNGAEVGYARFGGPLRAGVWFNSAASFVDLNPAGAFDSSGLGIFQGMQVGWARFPTGTHRASLWANTAASWVDLHPLAAISSEAYAEYRTPAGVDIQAGIAEIGGNLHASYWSGTPGSWVDLHSFLPPGYTSSVGTGIWTNNPGTLTFVCGYALNTTTGQSEAMLWRLPIPTPITSFCPGDGTSTACPCGNDAPLGASTGCLHSLGTGGKVVATGTASISNDSLVLLGSQMPNSSALYFQGTAQVSAGAGQVFGDGLRCAGGSVTRLGTKTNVTGASSYPTVGDLSVSVKGQVTTPGTRTYQIWYRNSDPVFCTPSTFNLTNGLSVAWAL